jgi:hypothetical protein
VRVMVITGAGRGFCTGADVEVMADLLERGDVETFAELVNAGMRVVRRLRAMEQPVIAAVNGPAAGAGAALALACDFRVASAASRPSASPSTASGCTRTGARRTSSRAWWARPRRGADRDGADGGRCGGGGAHRPLRPRGARGGVRRRGAARSRRSWPPSRRSRCGWRSATLARSLAGDLGRRAASGEGGAAPLLPLRRRARGDRRVQGEAEGRCSGGSKKALTP